jgi:hypothetical protein
MMKCQFCEREINNKGSLAAHQKYCKLNPNAIQKIRSLAAGVKKGNVPWNAGKTFREDVIIRTTHIVESGEIETLTEANARRHAKRYLIHTTGNICSRCGVTEWMGEPVPLVCDHISGDSSDNRIENFRLVCCNCDAQLPTFKSKNRGKGRDYDREYRQKKSAEKAST